MPDVEMNSANDSVGYDVDYVYNEFEANHYYFYEWTDKDKELFATEKTSAWCGGFI